MKSSSSNQFAGTVTAVQMGPVTASVLLALQTGSELTATITSAAAERLKLARGKQVLAWVDASAVALVTDSASWHLSARNQLAGTVLRIEPGAPSSLVLLALPGGAELTASVANDAVQRLSLAVGLPVTAVFKAYAVMLAVQA